MNRRQLCCPTLQTATSDLEILRLLIMREKRGSYLAPSIFFFVA